jgi:hypothetical protein
VVGLGKNINLLPPVYTSLSRSFYANLINKEVPYGMKVLIVHARIVQSGTLCRRGTECFSSPRCPECLWGPISLPSNGYCGTFFIITVQSITTQFIDVRLNSSFSRHVSTFRGSKIWCIAPPTRSCIPWCWVALSHSLDTQHNRKSHPAPWNTRARRWEYTSNIRTTKRKHNRFHQQF